MARADNATQMRDNKPIAAILKLPEELQYTSERPRPSSDVLAARERFVKDIRNHISNNRAVSYQGVLLQSMQGFQHGGYQHGVTIYVAFSLLAEHVYEIIPVQLSSQIYS